MELIRKTIIVVLAAGAFTTGCGWVLSFQSNLNVWRYDRIRGVLTTATIDDGWLRVRREGGVARISCANGEVRGWTCGTNEYIVSLGDLWYMTEPDPPSAALYRMYLLPLWPIPLLLAIGPVAALWKRIRRPVPCHCRKHGYNLSGNVTGVCSECGMEIQSKGG